MKTFTIAALAGAAAATNVSNSSSFPNIPTNIFRAAGVQMVAVSTAPATQTTHVLLSNQEVSVDGTTTTTETVSEPMEACNSQASHAAAGAVAIASVRAAGRSVLQVLLHPKEAQPALDAEPALLVSPLIKSMSLQR